jgi:hypothetical protein
MLSDKNSEISLQYVVGQDFGNTPTDAFYNMLYRTMDIKLRNLPIFELPLNV